MKTFTEYLNEATKMSLIKVYTLISDEVDTILKKLYKDYTSRDFKSNLKWDQKTKTKLFVIKFSDDNPRKEFPIIMNALKSAYSKQENFKCDESFCRFKYNGFQVTFYISSVGNVWVEVEVKKI